MFACSIFSNGGGKRKKNLFSHCNIEGAEKEEATDVVAVEIDVSCHTYERVMSHIDLIRAPHTSDFPQTS